MRLSHRTVWVCVLTAMFAAAARGQSPAPSPVLGIMKDELARNMQTLKAQPPPAYFVGYEIIERRSIGVSGSFGTLTGSHDSRHRTRSTWTCGSATTHSTTRIRCVETSLVSRRRWLQPADGRKCRSTTTRWPFAPPSGSRPITEFKRAIEAAPARQPRPISEVKVAAEDRSPDFSHETPEQHVDPVASLSVDRRAWDEFKVGDTWRLFAQYGDIYEANATFTAEVDTRWYVNSEGAAIQTSQPAYRLQITAHTKADDGMELPRYETFFATAADRLPGDQAVMKAVAKMIRDLHALRVAPVIEPYSGPAILSGRASAVFFHEVFGHRIEGQRQKREDEGQTFKKKVNEPVLPAAFSVYFDPTLKQLGSTELAGHYLYDNEGVKARRVVAVENGVLRSFLMSRMPVEGFPVSNGHGRNQPGLAPAARQSNLIVEVAAPRTHAQLRQMLIEQITQENRPYGLFFDDIEGGFTMTGRTIPNAFNVLPIMVYRVFPDGREELVRGVDLIGTPLTVFSRIARRG